ncbi:MAG: rRNA maturation RNase YbeY, partial [Gammaproteobacteria bacterium]
MSLTLDLQIATPDTGLPTAEDIQRWAELALVAGHEETEVTIRLVDEDEIQALNRDYRGKDKPTNVLSFPFENPPGLELPLLGDILICPEVVSREAEEQGKPLNHHWAHMII